MCSQHIWLSTVWLLPSLLSTPVSANRNLFLPCNPSLNCVGGNLFMTFRLLPLKLFGDGESLSRDEISCRGFSVLWGWGSVWRWHLHGRVFWELFLNPLDSPEFFWSLPIISSVVQFPATSQLFANSLQRRWCWWTLGIHKSPSQHPVGCSHAASLALPASTAVCLLSSRSSKQWERIAEFRKDVDFVFQLRLRVLHAELCSSLVQHENKSHRVTEKKKKEKRNWLLLLWIYIHHLNLFNTSACSNNTQFFLLPLFIPFFAQRWRMKKINEKQSQTHKKSILRRSCSQVSFNKLSKMTKTKAVHTGLLLHTFLPSHVMASHAEVDSEEPEYFKFYQTKELLWYWYKLCCLALFDEECRRDLIIFFK